MLKKEDYVNILLPKMNEFLGDGISEEKKIKIIEFIYNIQNEAQLHTKEWYENYAKENELPYIDLNMKTKEIGIDWKTDSYDKGDHLNLHGAQKVTAYMGKYLTENYSMPDHRGEDGGDNR